MLGSMQYAFMSQTGPVAISMTNDYQFRAIMQMNKRVLKGLLGALLHLEERQITSVEIRNPVELGKHIDDKEYVMDILVTVNGHITVNIELQVINEHNWQERSLIYLCREFDHLNRGEDYVDVRPVIQIGLLDFSLFDGEPEFYASYALRNEKSGKLYTDKFKLKVMELRQSEIATEEDRKWKLDKWARFFKSKSWEEIKMLTKDLPVLGEAAEMVYEVSADEKIRRQCEAREEFIRRQRTTQRLMEMQEQKIEEQNRRIREREKKIQERDKQIQERDKQIQERDKQLQEKEGKIQERDKQLQEKEGKIQERDKQLQEKEGEIQERDKQLQERDKQLQEKDEKLQEKDEQLKKYRAFMESKGFSASDLA